MIDAASSDRYSGMRGDQSSLPIPTSKMAASKAPVDAFQRQPGRPAGCFGRGLTLFINPQMFLQPSNLAV